MTSGKKKALLIGGGIALVIIIAAVIAVSANSRKNKNADHAESTVETQAMTTLDPESEGEASADPEAAAETTAPAGAEETTAPADGSTPSGGTAAGGTGTTGSAGSSGTNPSGSAGNGSTEQKSTALSFPYTDSSSGLVINSVNSYDGMYMEDGSDEQVSGIMVIILKNNSGSDMEYAQITLKQGDTEYNFNVSGLPAGATAIVQEQNRKAYSEGSYTSCTIAATEAETFSMNENLVTVGETEDGSLTVTNVSGSDIPCVRVFYKYYTSDEDVYVGGITYTAKLTGLGAGKTITVMPSHYQPGYSKVIMVRTYDSTED